MDVERDLVGIVLPFVAGVASTVFCGSIFHVSFPLSAGLICTIMAASVIFLSYSRHLNIPPTFLRLTICLSLISCGILCGLSAEALSVTQRPGERFMEQISTTGIYIGNMIDSVRFISPDTNAILKALIIGDRSDIPAHITDSFRLSGASHILALSGLHLGIIYGIISRISSIMGNAYHSRILRSTCIILICGLYTLTVGAGPSIVRAFLFILLGETARMTGRNAGTGHVLITSLMIHLIFVPQDLHEVGFQLSYAAMAGIAFVFPWLHKFWPDLSQKRNPLYWIWKTSALSISCQLTTAPLVWVYFGTFPINFILTNLISIPLIGLIIPSALITIGMATCGIYPEIFSRATEMLVTALSDALDIIASM